MIECANSSSDLQWKIDSGWELNEWWPRRLNRYRRWPENRSMANKWIDRNARDKKSNISLHSQPLPICARWSNNGDLEVESRWWNLLVCGLSSASLNQASVSTIRWRWWLEVEIFVNLSWFWHFIHSAKFLVFVLLCSVCALKSQQPSSLKSFSIKTLSIDRLTTLSAAAAVRSSRDE